MLVDDFLRRSLYVILLNQHIDNEKVILLNYQDVYSNVIVKYVSIFCHCSFFF